MSFTAQILMFTISIMLFYYYLLFCFSCSSHKHPDKKIFRYNEASGIATLDPAFAKNQSVMWAVHQLYNTLVEVDENMQLKPSLAKSWEFSADKRSIVFHLRTDVFFHDDAVFPKCKRKKTYGSRCAYTAFNRIMDPKTASPGAWIFNNRVDSIQAFIAMDDSTFQLNLIAAFSTHTRHTKYAILFYRTQGSSRKIWYRFSASSCWHRAVLHL